MVENNLTGLISKMKTATKQAANETMRQAEIARLRFDLMTLHSEKAKYLQNIGSSLFSLYKQKSNFDQNSLFSDCSIKVPGPKANGPSIPETTGI